MAKPAYMALIDANLTPQQSQQQRIALIKEIEALTKRRLLVYVASIGKQESSLTPDDKTAFSDLIEGVDTDAVDVLVNSPGGFAEVTESIVGMLRARYKSVRFIVPNSAKSAATLMVLSGDSILMDARGELGPIDPQMQYMTREGPKREAAEAITEGFNAAKEALKKEGPSATPAYLPLLEKYTIGLLQACVNAKKLSETLAKGWLQTYMFGDAPGSALPEEIARYFASHTETLSHSRPIRIDTCERLKLKIENLDLPENHKLRDVVWRLWCHYELHLERALTVTKMFENSSGCSIQKHNVQVQLLAQPQPQPQPVKAPQRGPVPGLPGQPFNPKR